MARQTNTAITYNDANYMILNEGFSLKDTSITGNKCMTKEEVIDYMNVDETRLTSYANNQLVPYHLLSPEVNTCCAPIFTSIQDYSATQLALNWSVSTTGCSAHNAVTTASSTDLVNWSNSTGDPNSPRIYTKPSVLTYYRLKAHCTDGDSEWSDTKSWAPAAIPSPITLGMVTDSEIQSTFTLRNGSADQNITVEFELTAKSGSSNSYVEILETLTLHNTGDRVLDYTPLLSTGNDYRIKFQGASQGDSATVKATLKAASVDGIPTDDNRSVVFNLIGNPNVLTIGVEDYGTDQNQKYFTVDNFSEANTIEVEYTLLSGNLQGGSVSVQGESLSSNVPKTITANAGPSKWKSLITLSNIPGASANVRCKLISTTLDTIPTSDTETIGLSVASSVAPPSIPVTLDAVWATNTNCRVTWLASTSSESTVAYYNIWRMDDIAVSSPFVLIGTSTGLSYDDTTADRFNGPSYWYRVTAVDAVGNESDADDGQIPPKVTVPPDTPSSISVVWLTNTSTRFTWTESEDAAGDPVRHYEVWRKTNVNDGSPFVKIAEVSGLSYDDTDVDRYNSNGDSYWYQVYAVDYYRNKSSADGGKITPL